jgi:hypothetical protein
MPSAQSDGGRSERCNEHRSHDGLVRRAGGTPSRAEGVHLLLTLVLDIPSLREGICSVTVSSATKGMTG